WHRCLFYRFEDHGPQSSPKAPMNKYPHLLPAFQPLLEPYLAFHPDRPEDRHMHPLEGLIHFGPFSRSLAYHIYDPIRVALICPFGATTDVDRLLHELQGQHAPRERLQYLVNFTGFTQIFG